jgi:hypothetical protein
VTIGHKTTGLEISSRAAHIVNNHYIPLFKQNNSIRYLSVDAHAWYFGLDNGVFVSSFLSDLNNTRGAGAPLFNITQTYTNTITTPPAPDIYSRSTLLFFFLKMGCKNGYLAKSTDPCAAAQKSIKSCVPSFLLCLH